MANRRPQKGGIKKKSKPLKSITKLGLESATRFKSYYDPLINRTIKEILKENNRL